MAGRANEFFQMAIGDWRAIDPECGDGDVSSG
jgi:hypothetical protein